MIEEDWFEESSIVQFPVDLGLGFFVTLLTVRPSPSMTAIRQDGQEVSIANSLVSIVRIRLSWAFPPLFELFCAFYRPTFRMQLSA